MDAGFSRRFFSIVVEGAFLEGVFEIGCVFWMVFRGDVVVNCW
jgi:hypothetical protein